MREVPLTRGLVALVDDEDFVRISTYRWYAHVSARGRTYAARKVANGERDGRTVYTVEYMHHAIAGKPEGLVIDHLNWDSLDNRKANLGERTQSQNILNSSAGQGKGVWLCKMTGRYGARASIDKRRVFLGRFDTEAEAIQAVREFRAAAQEPAHGLVDKRAKTRHYKTLRKRTTGL